MAVRRTTRSEVSELLAALGVRPGDTVMLHSALMTLGLIDGGIAAFHGAVRDAIGPDGTLIVPTFTWSFRRNEVYDVRRSPVPKSLGATPEFLRMQEGVLRSLDPLFSMAAEGPRAAELTQRESKACFGLGSAYERLFRSDVLFIALGITYSTGLSAFMHLEKLAEVPYRKDLLLTGETVGYDDRRSADEAVHYSRDEDAFAGWHTNREPMGAALEDAGISRAVTFGSGRHFALRAQPFAEFVLDRLERDPLCMAVSPTAA